MKDLLDLLGEDYRASLPEKLSTLRTSIGDVSELEMGLHKLAGSASAYGFVDIGRAARHAENLLVEGQPFEAALDTLFALIEREIP